MAGTLFVVGTPIGNLEDLTFRALRTLREVDLIAAEDTRRTAKLLARYEIRKPLVSLREHNETREAPRLLARLAQGQAVALVSDAGTPGISDPGARLVNAVRKAGFPVVPIPGPSAVTAALSVSGTGADGFVFMGFPPSSGPSRDEWMSRLAREGRTIVFFESPHRIDRTVRDVLEVKEPIFIHNELTKIHETCIISTKNEIPDRKLGRGEFTVVVPGLDEQASSIDESGISELYFKLVSGASFDQEEAKTLTARAHAVSTSLVRKIVKKSQILAKRQNKVST